MDIQQAFNNAAADYDHLRRILIPCFDDFYKTAVEVIPDNHLASLKVLGKYTSVRIQEPEC